MKRLVLLCLAAVPLIGAESMSAAELFRDEMVNAGGWGINKGTDPDSAATFGYDYSADGIPEAPNSVGGDTPTSGAKLEANHTDFTDSAAFFTMYPLGQDFTGNFKLRFDQWQNYDVVEQIDGSASGTTEFMGGGIGYDGVTADIASGAQAVSTGDGGSSNDWRAFKSPPQFFIPDEDMTAGDHNGAAAHHANFLPGVEPPASQGQAGPNAPYLGRAGSPSFQWITWEFRVFGDRVAIDIEKPNGDRLNIVSYDKTDTSDGSAGVSTDGNISIFYADFFSSVSPRPDLTFGIVDNVVVSSIPVPEPATLTLLGLAGTFGLLGCRRRAS